MFYEYSSSDISHLIGNLAGSDINGPLGVIPVTISLQWMRTWKVCKRKVSWNDFSKSKYSARYFFSIEVENAVRCRDLSGNWISKYFNKFQSIEGHNSILQKWKCYSSIITTLDLQSIYMYVLGSFIQTIFVSER